MNLARIYRKLKACKEVFRGKAQVSFSQYGEDLIIRSLLKKLGINQPTYLDIGANDPVLASNTFGFYLQGFTGVLIEPNPALCKILKRKRPLDTIVNAGIGSENDSSADYFVFEEPDNALNTFSESDAVARQSEGIRLKEKIKMELIGINILLNQHFADAPPTILSMDTEGMDEAIIRSIDFTKCAPVIICIESEFYVVNGLGEKRGNTSQFLLQSGYTLYADTHANSIFCRTEILNAH